MRSKNYSVLMIGLLALGFLIVNHLMPWEPADAQAVGEPSIVFQLPEGSPRYVDTADPIDPAIPISVQVDFQPVSPACAGEPLPVMPETLDVKLHRQIDGAVQETWDLPETGWVWNGENNNVTGTVTIGGPGSGQDRSLYGIEVCISNSSASACATKGIRVEHSVSDLERKIYNAKANSFNQSGCTLIDPGLIPLINNMMRDKLFGVGVPSAADMTAVPPDPPVDDIVNFGGIPLIGNIDIPASLNAGTNNVDLVEVSVSGIDLGGITGLPPGYNCEISGSADGLLLGPVSPGLDLDGSIRVYGITLTDGSGTGSCTRDATGCELNIVFDGNPL